jgi:uncharacterized protein (TIGR02145 family)
MNIQLFKIPVFALVLLAFASSCTKETLMEEKSAGLIYGTMTDQESNTYKTIRIGDQVWMAENLRTTIYSDGTPIPNVTDDQKFHFLSTGAFCNYNNDPENGKTYGRLYNWHAVGSSHKLAPEGWHVPTEKDWEQLAKYLGGEKVAGGKLKETGTTHWNAQNIGATNTFGFNALPGGTRAEDGEFSFLGTTGYWWSSTEGNQRSALLRGTGNTVTTLMLQYYYKEYGFSVRLIKD